MRVMKHKNRSLTDITKNQDMQEKDLKNIIEASLLAAGKPLTLDNIIAVFADDAVPDRDVIRKTIHVLNEEYKDRGIEIKQIASGYRLQVRKELAPWVSRLWEEKPTRYTRALLETLALIAYRQPVTRGEIENIRGVSVSSNIIRTLQEREWVRIVGHRDVPGKPAMYGTTREFLDYFNLKSLTQLPSLEELRDVDSINAELDLSDNPVTKKHESRGDKPAEAVIEESDALAEADSQTGEQTSPEQQTETLH